MPGDDEQWIDLDLSDAGLRAPVSTQDDLAAAVALVYERFVPYADAGWEWVTQPGTRAFDGWTYRLSADGDLRVASAHLQIRRVAPVSWQRVGHSTHGVSAYRTQQLTERPWTSEPGSKAWKPIVAERKSPDAD
jgi:hypothetical protein